MKIPELNPEFKTNPRRCPTCGRNNLNCKIQRISLHIAHIQCNLNKVVVQELVLRPAANS